jgi:uncharacterized protein
MILKERINEDLKAAMKGGEKVRLEAVRAIKKEIIEKETAEKRATRGDLTPDEELDVIVSMIKRRKDSIDQFKAANRQDLVDQEAAQLVFIEQYAPKQLSEDEVKAAVQSVITQTGATSQKEVGKVMGAAMKELKGKADGTLVQKIAKELLPE